MKSKRGRPKSPRENAKNVSLTIAPKGWTLLQSQAHQLGMTRSELVERFARGKIQGNLSEPYNFHMLVLLKVIMDLLIPTKNKGR